MTKIINYAIQEKNRLNQSVFQTPIKGLFYIDNQQHCDDRGFFAEIIRLPELNQQLDGEFKVKRINLSSSKTNVIRGFHCENLQKLITVIHGRAFIALADLRPKSATFGQVLTATIGPQEKLHGAFFLPLGIGNSFLALNDNTRYLYAVDKLYSERNPEEEDIAISLFDPDLNVPWPIDKSSLIYSQRDAEAVSLRAKFPEKFP